MAQGRFCEHKDHGPDQTLIVAIVGIGDGNGTMTWLCQEHFNDAMYQLGQLPVAEGSIDQRCRHHVRGRVMDSAYYRDGEHLGHKARRPPGRVTPANRRSPRRSRPRPATSSTRKESRQPRPSRREIDELPRGARMSYDSRPDTIAHAMRVRELLLPVLG